MAGTNPNLLLAQLNGHGRRPSANGNSSYFNNSEESKQLPEFPVDVFPGHVRRFIEEGANAINVPPDMVAAPLLGFAAGAIGNTRAVLVKPGWIERANLWLAIIGEPGSAKSPAMSYARQPLDALQHDAWERYQGELTLWEEATAAAKASKGNTDPLPDRPVLDHFFSTDATTEALASILSTSPGVAVVRDELVGWVKSHDAYRQAGDRQNYLSLWAGSPLKVDRKSAQTLYIRFPCVPIVGGIQPDMLSDLGEEAQRRDGFVERILMVWPNARPIRWNDTEIDPAAARGVAATFRLLRASGAGDNASVVALTNEARQVFGRWFEENGRIAEESHGVAAGCYSKYPSQLARLALVLHALRYPSEPERRIDVDTLSDAIRVIEYFRAHLVRVLPMFDAVGSTKSAGIATRILRVLGKAGGEWITRTELSRGLGNSVEAADVDEVLASLEADGQVENRTVQTGARPRQESRIPSRKNHVPPSELLIYEEFTTAPTPPTPNNEEMNSSPSGHARSPAPLFPAAPDRGTPGQAGHDRYMQ